MTWERDEAGISGNSVTVRIGPSDVRGVMFPDYVDAILRLTLMSRVDDHI